MLGYFTVNLLMNYYFYELQGFQLLGHNQKHMTYLFFSKSTQMIRLKTLVELERNVILFQ